MSVTLDKPIIGLRASANGSAAVFVPGAEGFCDGVTLNQPYVGLRAASDGNDIVFVVGDQKLNGDGTLILNKPYIGQLSSIDGDAKVFTLAGKQCCYCTTTTGWPNPTTGRHFRGRITSAIGVLDFPMRYLDDVYAAGGYPGLGGLFPNLMLADKKQGWISQFFFVNKPGTLEQMCGSNPMLIMVEVRRCDMKVWITQNLTPGPVRYDQCNDSGDIVTCSPFYLKRKMDLATPGYWLGGSGDADPHVLPPIVSRPLTACSGATGADCTGEEYFEMYASVAGPWDGDWDGNWPGDWYG